MPDNQKSPQSHGSAQERTSAPAVPQGRRSAFWIVVERCLRRASRQLVGVDPKLVKHLAMIYANDEMAQLSDIDTKQSAERYLPDSASARSFLKHLRLPFHHNAKIVKLPKGIFAVRWDWPVPPRDPVH